MRNGRLGCGEMVDDGCCSCDADAGGSAEVGSSTSKCGAVGRQRISVMLRCFRIGFVHDPFVLFCAEVACADITGLGRGSQSEPGCNGPYNQVTSESFSLESRKRLGQQLRARDDKEMGDGPVESLGANRPKLVPLFPPSSPASVLETGAVGNLVLLPGHAFPRTPDVFLSPLV